MSASPIEPGTIIYVAQSDPGDDTSPIEAYMVPPGSDDMNDWKPLGQAFFGGNDDEESENNNVTFLWMVRCLAKLHELEVDNQTDVEA